MPLLHEIKDLDNEAILCFLPNGHLTDKGFKDFPAQLGLTCSYYANHRLVSLKHTQNPFNEAEYGPIAIILSHLTDKLGSIEKIYRMCLRIFFTLIEDELTINSTTLQIYLDHLPNLVKEELQEIDTTEKPNVFPIKIKRNYEIFKEMFLYMGEALVSNCHKINVTNFQEFNLTFTKVFFEYMKKITLEIHNAYYEYIPLEDLLTKEGLSFDLARKKDIEPRSLQVIVFGLNQAIIPITEDQELNYSSWKAFFIKVLLELGPFIVAGDVGVAYYSGSTPRNCGTLGSVTLLGFDNKTYNRQNINISHVVIVIGIYKNKVIYLDPVDNSTVTGSRQAYVMDMYKFMDRIKTVNQFIYNGILRLTTVKQGEIDTTLELMEAHTKKNPTLLLQTSSETANAQDEFKDDNDVRSRYITWIMDIARENKQGCFSPPNSYINENGITIVPSRIPFQY